MRPSNPNREDDAVFTPLPSPGEMASWDQAAIREIGLSPQVLMENAGREACRVLAQELGALAGRRLLCLAGPGNNGGDALVLARTAREAGAEVLVLATKPQKAYRGEARHNLRLARRLGLKILSAARFSPRDHAPFDAVVDGLLGTGFAGSLRPEAAALVALVNDLGRRALVLALDVPSGLDGLTGLPCPEAVRAHVTVTFEAAKPGLVLARAAPFVGRLVVRPIGLPNLVKARRPASFALLGPGLFRLRGPADPLLHKGRAGRLLIVGGSRGLTGAPRLAGLGALRAGAGLVALACPGALEAMVKGDCPELMSRPLGETAVWSGALADDPALTAFPADAAVLGPGLGREPGAVEFLRRFLPREVPLVVDADALRALADHPSLKDRLGPKAVLTPHPGEAAGLLKTSAAAVEADRPGAALALAETFRAVVVLKGPNSLIARAPADEPTTTAEGAAPVHDFSHGPPPRLFVSPLAAANLAVGGSGDVLSGVIGALLAAGVSPLPAACLGVYWHGLAGAALAAGHPGRGDLASEIAHILPRIAKERSHA